MSTAETVEKEATKPVRIRESLHAELRIKAAREKRKLGELAEEIIAAALQPAELHAFPKQ